MINESFWKGKKVLITGHTGFKGAWLSIWLNKLGADVTGYALMPPTNPSLFDLCRLDKDFPSVIGDVRDKENLRKTIIEANPDIVIHMAAQTLVKKSYLNPVETYETNVLGTVYLLDAIRECNNVRVIINVTTDKCYENREWVWGYRENDPLGGSDPYSNSKACSEFVTDSFKQSFFPLEKFHEHGVAIATSRAGNVIGGGDWAENRLIPDIFYAISKKELLNIRYPNATRPWQHVLEPLSGYLILAEKLYLNGKVYSSAWNFGPNRENNKTVKWIVEYLAGKLTFDYKVETNSFQKESHFLMLDSSKAIHNLGWQPKWGIEKTLDLIIEWYEGYKNPYNIKDVCLNQIKSYQK